MDGAREHKNKHDGGSAVLRLMTIEWSNEMLYDFKRSSYLTKPCCTIACLCALVPGRQMHEREESIKGLNLIACIFLLIYHFLGG